MLVILSIFIKLEKSNKIESKFSCKLSGVCYDLKMLLGTLVIIGEALAALLTALAGL